MRVHKFKRRKGMTLIETLMTAVLLSLIMMGVTSTTITVRNLEANTKNSVYLRTHNLNCMERLRQECLYANGNMLAFYGDETYGTLSIETNVFLEQTKWDDFNIYQVKIESKMRDSKQRLTSEYILTDIGAISYDGLIS